MELGLAAECQTRPNTLLTVAVEDRIDREALAPDPCLRGTVRRAGAKIEVANVEGLGEDPVIESGLILPEFGGRDERCSAV